MEKPEEPEVPYVEIPLRRFRVRSDITVEAKSPDEARTLGTFLTQYWSDETGYAHISGFGDLRGSVTVEEVAENA
jgi:hypothetical protein